MELAGLGWAKFESKVLLKFPSGLLINQWMVYLKYGVITDVYNLQAIG
jgi:hypothetical protein